MNERHAMRRQGLRARDAMPPEERGRAGALICQRLLESSWFRNARCLLCYVSYRSEVPTGLLLAATLRAGKRLTVPLTLPKEKALLAVTIEDPERELRPGYCGIPEPSPEQAAQRRIDPATLEMVIVPGAVFDPGGGRLGYGGGYYDRFLQAQAPGALRVALAFDLQLTDRVPLAAHDQPMDVIVTEHQIFLCSGGRHGENRCLS